MSQKLDSTRTTDTETVLDAYGRQSRSAIYTGTDWTITDTCYDTAGRVKATSLPYSATDLSGAQVCSSGSAVLTSYDALDRMTAQATPSGTSQWIYAGNIVDYYDESNKHWAKTSDAFGRLTHVVEDPSGLNLSSDYSYDTLGNLTSVSQLGSSGDTARSRSFIYDSLSRLTSATSPESGTDSYQYDANSNLYTHTDARNVTTTYAYDALNRPISKHYSDTTLPITYSYDGLDENGNVISGPTNVIGRLTHASNGYNAASTYWYDVMGRPTQKKLCIPGDCSYNIAVQSSYDYLGNRTTLTNGSPSTGVLWTYGYDVASRLSTVTSSWDDATHPATLFRADAYVASGLANASFAISSQTQQPAITQSRVYDSLGRVTSENVQGKVQVSASAPSAGTITVTGTESEIPPTAAAPGVGSVNIQGSLQSTTVRLCNDPNDVSASNCWYETYTDYGNVYVTVGSYTGTAQFGYSGDTADVVASRLVTNINNDGAANVTASVSGSTVTLTAKTTGAATNYSLSTSTSWDTTNFYSSSFTANPSGGSLTGGVDGTPTTIYDAGTISATLNGVTSTINWGQGSSASSIASDLASAIQANSGSIVNASANGSTIQLTSASAGGGTNWPITMNVTYDSSHFGASSFSSSSSGMSGGVDAGIQNGTIYSYAMSSNGYAPNGNLQDVDDSVMGHWGFQYDALNRLSSASASSGVYSGLGINWGYDAFGNRTSETFSGTASVSLPTSSSAQFNSLNRVSNSNYSVGGFSYDNSGGVLNDGVNQYLYDAEGRMCAIYNGYTGVTTGYVYDPEGNRVAKGTLTSFSCDLASNGFALTNNFVRGFIGEELTMNGGDGTWWHSNVYTNAGLLGTYGGGTVYFAIKDWLGTKRALATSDGLISSSYRNLPWGNGLDTAGTGPDASNHHFAGTEADPESGLEHAIYRQYSSRMGTWTTPDRYSGSYDWGNPQSFNRYVYVGASPIMFRDMSGLSPACMQTGVVSVGGAYWIFVSCASTALCGPVCGTIIGGAALGIEELGRFLGLWGKPQFTGSLTPRPEPRQAPKKQMTKLTKAQCAAAEKVLERENEFGTARAARMSGNTFDFADRTIEPFNSSYTPNLTLDNGEELDLDWFTDLTSTHWVLYPAAKLYWSYLRSGNMPIGHVLPFADPGERTAFVDAVGGTQYKDIFTPDMMKACHE